MNGGKCMKAIGDNSVSSFLKIILNVLWYMLFIGFGLVFISVFSTYDKYGMANFAWNLAFLAAYGLVLIIIFDLRKIMQTLILKKPFVDENVKRFRLIGYSVFIIGAFNFIYDIIKYKSQSFYLLHVEESGISSRVGILIYIILGCFSLILAEIFKMAKNIEEENNLTI
jgi:lysylphosphatidylglycerol synthetase-like protein (DUF2156 family)